VLEQEEVSVKILLADDHTIVRRELYSLLEKEPDIKVVSEADLVAMDTYPRALRNGLISIDITPHRIQSSKKAC
jgi:DNA-binding NarL/FixJ family response regulator